MRQLQTLSSDVKYSAHNYGYAYSFPAEDHCELLNFSMNVFGETIPSTTYKTSSTGHREFWRTGWLNAGIITKIFEYYFWDCIGFLFYSYWLSPLNAVCVRVIMKHRRICWLATMGLENRAEQCGSFGISPFCFKRN